MMTEQDLLSLKKDIEKAKSKVIELNAEKKLLMKQLKTDFESTSIEDAEILLDKWEQVFENVQDKISKGIEEIEKKYPQL